MKKIICLLLVLLTLAACSSEKQVTTENSFVVGMECDYAPFNWSQTEKGEGIAINEVDYADGYDVAMAKKIADSLGKTLVIKKCEWDNLIISLNAGDIDAIIAGMTDTEERRQSVNFTSPYYESEMVIIVNKNSELNNIKSIQELKGHKVLGQLNTLYDDCIDQIDGVIHATPMDSYPRMIIALKEGEVDALVGELPVANAIVEANNDLSYVKFSKENGFVADTSVSIALRKDDSELLNEIETILNGITADERNEMMYAAISRQPSLGE